MVRVLHYIAFCLVLMITPQVLSKSLFVSPDGDDGNPGTFGSPKRSIQAAAGFLNAGDTLYLLEGLYHEELNIQNLKGTIASPVVFKAYKDDIAVIDGTVDLDDITPPGASWELATDSFPGTTHIYKLQVEEDIWQLFVRQPERMSVPNAVGGELADYRMQVVARWPNAGTNPCDPLQRQEGSTEAAPNTWWSFTTTWGFASHPETNHSQFVNVPTRFNLAGTGKSFKGGTAIVSAIRQGPANIPVNILEHQAGSDLVIHSGLDENYGIYSYPSDHGPSFVIQHLQALDKPGEWYYDVSTKTVYLWPEDNGNPNGMSIRGKTQTYGIDLYNCEHIVFDGIGLFGTSMKLDAEYISFTNGAISYPDMPKTLLGIYGIEVPAIDARQCWYFTMRNTIVEYSQYHLIEVKNVGSVFDNNYFHHLGMMGYGASGCFLNVNTFTNNTIETVGNRAAVKCNSSPESGRNQSWNILDGWGFLYANDGVGFQTNQGGSRNSMRAYNWFIRSNKPGHRYDGPDEGFPGQPTLGFSHHLVGLRTKSISTNIKGDYNQVYNYLGIQSTSEHGDIAIRFNVETGEGNAHTIMRNCAADGINIGKWDPLPCIHSNNWDASKLGGSMLEYHPAADFLDFRPKAGAPMLNAGYEVPGVTDGFLGSAPDIGAYEWGDDTYWIPGYRGSSTDMPIPFDGAEDLPLDRDVMFRHAYMSDRAIVYFGTSKDAVRNASQASAKDPVSADVYSGDVVKIPLDSGRNIVTPTMIMGNPNNYDPAPYLLVDDPLTVLAPITTYYWRADAISEEGETTAGDVWRFSTGDLDLLVQFKVYEKQDGVVKPSYEAKAEVTNNILSTDSSGLTYGARLDQGHYSYRFHKKGFLPVEGSFFLRSDTIISDTIEYTNYDVTITIFDVDMNDPVPGASVDFGDMQAEADSSGSVQFSDIDYGYYRISATANDFLIPEAMEVEVYSDTAIHFYMTKDYRSGKLSILDKLDDSPIYRALVSTPQGEAGLTNENGEVSLEKIPSGWWIFTVEHPDYVTLHDSLFITQDTVTATLRLGQSKANVTLVISDNEGPVQNAAIRFDTWSVLSSAEGMAWFYFIPAQKAYSYTVETDTHVPVSDTFFLAKDTTINLILSIVSTKDSPFGAAFYTYPNPVADKLTIEFSESSGELSLMYADGKIVLADKLYSGTASLDVSNFASGTYYLRLKTPYSVYTRKVFIQNGNL